MITCPKCSKDNQDHYKFCLGCGAELPRDAAPKPFAPQTPAHGIKSAAGASAAATAASPGNVSPGNAGGFGASPSVAGAPSPIAAASPVAATQAFRPPSPSAPQAAIAAPAPAPAPLAPPPPAPVPLNVAAAAAPIAPPAAAPAAVFSGGGAGGAPGGSMPSGGAPAAASAQVVCPQCGHINGPSNTFCGSCGFRLGGSARPSIAAAAPPAAEVVGSVILTALRADGSEAGTYTLPGATVTVGRDSGGIFAGDSYLSPRHATLRQPAPGRLLVKDEASLNGVYKKLARDVPVELKQNDVFRIGQEIIRFEPLTPQPPSPDGVERLGAPSKGYVGRIALIIGRDATGNAFPVPEAGVHLGRERGDVLFPEDGYVSGLHCRLAWESGRGMLTDLGSSNGTFIRIREETEVRSGDVLLMGQQLFRINM